MSGEEYEVEKICDFRIQNGKKEFLIKWKGYDEDEWHTESDIDCPDLMEEFIKEHQEEMNKAIEEDKHHKGKKETSNAKKEDSPEEKPAEESEPKEEESSEKSNKGKRGRKPKKEKEEGEAKEKEEKPKKEKTKKKQTSNGKADKGKCKVLAVFEYKNKKYYTIEDSNGERHDVLSNKARFAYPDEIIAFLESQLHKE